MKMLSITLLQISTLTKTEMETIAIIAIILQIAISLSILKVWLIQYKTIVEDFKDFNLPVWLRNVVGTVKLMLTAALIGGIWVNWLAIYTTFLIGILMAGAVMAHYVARHSFKKSMEAVIVFILCVIVLYINLKYPYQNYITTGSVDFSD